MYIHLAFRVKRVRMYTVCTDRTTISIVYDKLSGQDRGSSELGTLGLTGPGRFPPSWGIGENRRLLSLLRY
jgi:hypothetical protein